MAAQSDSQQLKVFICYSRRDSSPFADELVAGLELLGFEAVIDREDIAAAEDWEARLAALIQASDTIIVVLSPEAVRSERCAWEVHKAQELSKRLIPIVGKTVRDEDVPAELRRLNYVFFSESHSFLRSLGQVADALRTDLDWIREHTRMAEAARRWHQRGRLESLLLRDDELSTAAAWMAARKAGSQEITDGQRALIAASVDAQAARANMEHQQLVEFAAAQTARAEALADGERTLQKLQRRTVLGGIGAGVFLLGTGGLSYWAMRAERLYREEREKVQRAQEASVEAGMLREAARTDLEGQLVAYAASPGQVAADAFKDERNSPYTKRLLEELADPSASIQVALSRAGQKVLSLTGFSQRPFVSSDMNGDIYVRHWPPSRARKALVVSVGTIGSFAFPNVPHDGDVWSAFLRTCGFDVTRLSEPTYQQLDNALRKVRFAHPETDQSENTVPNTFVLFVFSGAGSREGKDLFLWASDSLKPNVRFDASRALDVEGLSTRLRNAAAASVIILDTAFPDTS